MIKTIHKKLCSLSDRNFQTPLYDHIFVCMCKCKNILPKKIMCNIFRDNPCWFKLAGNVYSTKRPITKYVTQKHRNFLPSSPNVTISHHFPLNTSPLSHPKKWETMSWKWADSQITYFLKYAYFLHKMYYLHGQLHLKVHKVVSLQLMST